MYTRLRSAPINLGGGTTTLTTVIDTNYRGIAVRSDVTIRERGGSEMWKNQKRHGKQREGQEQNKGAGWLDGWLVGAAWWNNDRASQDLYVDIEKRPGKKCPLSVTLLSVVLSSWPCRRRVSRDESWFNAMWNDRAPRIRWIIAAAANSGYQHRSDGFSIFHLQLPNFSQLFTRFYDSMILKLIVFIRHSLSRRAVNIETIYIGNRKSDMRSISLPGGVIKSRCHEVNYETEHRNPLNF